MRIQIMMTALIAVLAINVSTFGQEPKGKGSDDSAPAADRPQGETSRPRREPRRDEDQPPPPPGKGPKGKAEGPRYTPPGSTRNAFPPQPEFQTPLPPGAAPGQPIYPAPPGGGRAFYGSGGMQAFPGRPGMPGMPGGAGPFGDAPDDPEMRELIKQDAELDHRSHQMAQRLREASGDERARIREELADVVAKHFQVRQERRELQIKRMEEELKRLRDEIAKRNEAKKMIIDNRFRELTGESRDLDF